MAKSFGHFGVLEVPLREVYEAVHVLDRTRSQEALDALDAACAHHRMTVPNYCAHVVAVLRARLQPVEEATKPVELHIHQPSLEESTDSMDSESGTRLEEAAA